VLDYGSDIRHPHLLCPNSSVSNHNKRVCTAYTKFGEVDYLESLTPELAHNAQHVLY